MVDGRPGSTSTAARRLLWGAALAFACAGCATTGSVSGKVSTPGNKGADKAVVTAAPEDSKKRSHKAPSQAVLSFADGGFVPEVLLVDPGTVVRIENRDHIWHNAFSVASTAPFDVGAIAPGKTATVTLEKIGVVKVFCEFHSKETATIVVAPARARTRPMPDSTYQLGALPPGTYQITSWHPTYGTKTRLVALSPNEHATVNFRY